MLRDFLSMVRGTLKPKDSIKVCLVKSKISVFMLNYEAEKFSYNRGGVIIAEGRVRCALSNQLFRGEC
jgi:hypothetical protein